MINDPIIGRIDNDSKKNIESGIKSLSILQKRITKY
jgi:hypothetical protein